MPGLQGLRLNLRGLLKFTRFGLFRWRGQSNRMNLMSSRFSLLVLVLGLILGSLAVRIDSALLGGAYPLVDALGRLWVQSLQMVVIPLIVTQVIAGLTSDMLQSSTRMLRLSALLFVALYGLGLLISVAVSLTLIPWVHLEDGWVPPQLSEMAAVAVSGRPAEPLSVADWLVGLVPTNLIAAAARGEILQIMLFAILFGLAINRLADPARSLFKALAFGLAEAVMTIVRWVLLFTPLGIFSVAFALGRTSGLGTAGVLSQFVLLLCIALALYTLLQYPIACLGARVPLGAFARAVYPGQLVAVSTRSSLASVPTLMKGAEEALQMPGEVSSLVFPFAAATFRANRAVSSTTKMLFLAFLYGIDLTVTQLLLFMLLAALLSISSAGIPGGVGFGRSLPAYLAVGIPIEAVLLVETVDAIPDIFKTLTNVTAYMTVGSIVARWFGDRGEIQGPANGISPV